MRAIVKRFGVLAALAGLPACSPLGLLDAVVPTGGYVREAGIDYGDGPRQQLDLYRPPEASGPRPVVVFFYGGGWRTGDRGDYRFVGQALAAEGFVVAIPDYRLYPQVRFPAFVEDGAAAVSWVAANVERYGGDPDRIFLAGHSAGAHIATMLALDRRYLAAAGTPTAVPAGAAGLAGPYDWVPSGEIRRILAADEPGGRSAIPIDAAGPAAPAMLLQTGTDDDTVDPGNATRLAVRLRGAGRPVDVISYPGIGHAGILGALASPLTGLAPVRRDLVAWLRRNG